MACHFGNATPNSPAKEYAKDGWVAGFVSLPSIE